MSHRMLLKGIEGFSSSNLLVAGTNSSVFKAALKHNQMTITMKVFHLQKRGASKSFVAECKALSNICHKNLVRAITACSSVDYQGNDFKALVYEHMH